jgi:hypothetical protein
MYRLAKPAAQHPRADNGSPYHSRDPATTAATPAAPASTSASSLDYAATGTTTAVSHRPSSAPNPGTGISSSENVKVVTTTTAAADHAGAGAGTVRSSLLQPRVAVVLGVSKTWYPLLFACRLVSIAPGVVFGLPNALRLLAMLHLTFLGGGGLDGALGRVRLGRSDDGSSHGTTVPSSSSSTSSSPSPPSSPPASSGYDATFEARLRLTETLLATIWVSKGGAHRSTEKSLTDIVHHRSAARQGTSHSSSLTVSCHAGLLPPRSLS